MSEAEMKHTGVWDELETNETKQISKDSLLATIESNKVTSYSAVVNQKGVLKSVDVGWGSPTDPTKKISETARKSLVENFGEYDFSIIQTARNKLNLPEGDYQSEHLKSSDLVIVRLVAKLERTTYAAVFTNRDTGAASTIGPSHGGYERMGGFDTASDAMHAAEKQVTAFNNPDRAFGTDWQTLTIESKNLIPGGEIKT